jgi:hypothetical protein
VLSSAGRHKQQARGDRGAYGHSSSAHHHLLILHHYPSRMQLRTQKTIAQGKTNSQICVLGHLHAEQLIRQKPALEFFS